jgi:hypothetical protein
MQYEVIQEFIINVDSKDQGQIVLDKSVTTYMGAYLKAIPNEGNLGDALFG